MRATQFMAQTVSGAGGTVAGEWECLANSTNIVYLPPFIVGPDDFSVNGGFIEFNYWGRWSGSVTAAGPTPEAADSYNFLLYVSNLNDDPAAPQTGVATAAVAQFTHAITGINHRATVGTDDGMFWVRQTWGLNQQYYAAYTDPSTTVGAYRSMITSEVKFQPINNVVMQRFDLMGRSTASFDVAKRITPAIQRVAGGSATSILNAQAGCFEPRPNLNTTSPRRGY